MTGATRELFALETLIMQILVFTVSGNLVFDMLDDFFYINWITKWEFIKVSPSVVAELSCSCELDILPTFCICRTFIIMASATEEAPKRESKISLQRKNNCLIVWSDGERKQNRQWLRRERKKRSTICEERHLSYTIIPHTSTDQLKAHFSSANWQVPDSPLCTNCFRFFIPLPFVVCFWG